MSTLPDERLQYAVRDWLIRDPDAATRSELGQLIGDGEVDEVASRFDGRLAFGTAGLRGLVGAGPKRMNRLVVQETSAGFAAYLAEQVADARERGVMVTFDARPDSERFASDVASVFAGVGYRVFLTRDAQPTPVGAFGVLHLNAAAGVVVTASHNPPEYNGYKVYWENGAQIIPPHDSGIAACIDIAADEDIPWLDLDDAEASGQLTWLDDTFVEAYCDSVLELCAVERSTTSATVSAAYTALHGVGARIADTLVRRARVGELLSVPSQHEPDGRFPTVEFPNPEEPGAMDEVIALARSHGLEFAFANDPDADRLAVAVSDDDGEFHALTGDQVGVLLGDYLLRQKRAFTPIVCASMVSSRMLQVVAERAGAVFFETLTGFKWLANTALQHEDDDHRFLFAYEEALGYAVGRSVRDKDGLSALLVFLQLVISLKEQERSVFDRLEALYRRYGLFVTEQRSIATTPGERPVTDALRDAMPDTLAGQAVVRVKDLKRGECRHQGGTVESLDLYPSDVLVFYLADDSRVIVRPSGTEPKMKCYYEVIGDVAKDKDFADAERAARDRLATLANIHQAEMASL